MLIVDAQVHIWTSGTPVSIHRQVSAYTKDELLRDMDAAGVDAVVLHPPSWDARANEVAIEAARQLLELTGKAAEGVTSLQRTDDGWRVQVEVVEVRRIPDTTDVLSSYEVAFDDDRNLVSVAETRRYRRSQVEEGR